MNFDIKMFKIKQVVPDLLISNFFEHKVLVLISYCL